MTACVAISMGILLVGGEAAHADDISVPEVIRLGNDARQKQGLAPLTENIVLDTSAQEKAQDMIAHDYFAHTSPQGKSPWYWIDKNKYDYHFAGENLAINFTDARDQQRAWMDSVTHRDNILSAKYAETGVAVAHGTINGHQTTVTVQLFASPIGYAVGAEQVVAPAQTQAAMPRIAGYASYSGTAWEQSNMTFVKWMLAMAPLLAMAVLDSMHVIRKRSELKHLFAVRAIRTH